VTLTQLGAFVLVARLGSVRAAAAALGVSEPAVSQAIASLRKHFDDDLIVRDGNQMSLTAGGQRLISIASQIVNLGAEAESAVRRAQGAPDRLRIVTEPMIAEFVAAGLVEAFGAKAGGVETSIGVATRDEMPVLLHERLADVALGPALDRDLPGLDSAPIMRCQQVLVAGPQWQPVERSTDMSRLSWLVDPSASDLASPTAALLRRLGISDESVRVFPSQTAAWAAAAAGEGIAPALLHLVQPELARGSVRVLDVAGFPADLQWHVTTLGIDRRSPAAGSLRQFLATPAAMRLMHTPGRGVQPSRFRPPVYVTIWS
jgi:DNA-binding transcriptional LysR family regulator